MPHSPGPTPHRARRVAAPTLVACVTLAAAPALFACGTSGADTPSSPGKAPTSHDGGGTDAAATPGGAQADRPEAAVFANTSPYVLMYGYDKATNQVIFRKVQGYGHHTGTGGHRYTFDPDDSGSHRLRVSSPLDVHGSRRRGCGQDAHGVDVCSEDGLLTTLTDGTHLLVKVHVNDRSVIDTVEEVDGTITSD